MSKKRRLIIILGIIFLIICSIELTLRISGNLYLKKLYVHSLSSQDLSSDGTTIVCLGESSTAGLWVDEKESYPFQLQTMLRQHHPEEKISVFVPPHVGQNTSQIANRIEQYIKLYKPDLIIIMAGINNEWSLAESHILRFLSLDDITSMKIRAMILLDNLRLFRLLRYAYLKYVFDRQEQRYIENLKKTQYIWGGPEKVVFSPEEKDETKYFSVLNRQAFIRLWRYDIEKIISTAKAHNINVLLMTYHVNPSYLSTDEFIKIASKEHIPLVRNDLTFQPFMERNTINNYLLHDNWHPNKEGYYLIAKNVFEAIENNKLLEQ